MWTETEQIPIKKPAPPKPKTEEKKPEEKKPEEEGQKP